ncbi:MAG TPA: DUF4339 domain-containing protein, partial [Polyangiaceae bacterium]|nr:DUF4339 domain-containing protein [Polyangiaceae bacterium]
GNAILAAAQNPGSGAGQGLGLGAGFAMGQQMAQSMSPGVAAAPAGAFGAPPPAPGMPPPPAGEPLFHVSQNGQVQGPFPLSQLVAAIRGGQLSAAAFVWAAGMAAWQPAGQVPALAAQLGALPPPPPPPVG